MFKLNLKIAWRNLLKHKGSTAFNIIGLALGLAGFIFMVLFVNHEESYDTWSPELSNVYQVQEYSDYRTDDKKAHWQSKLGSGYAPIFTDQLPGVKAVTMISLDYKKQGLTVPGKRSFLEGGVRRSDSLFFKVMPYDFIYGNAETAFSKPLSIVLKRNLAEKYFGPGDPVGKTITIAGGAWKGSEDIYTVAGVVEEPKTPSAIDFSAVYFQDSHFFTFENDEGDETQIYVKMEPVHDLEIVNKAVQTAYLPLKDKYLTQDKRSLDEVVKAGNSPVMRLMPLAEVHQQPLEGKSWQDKISPVLLLSVLLLVVAVINFINLATAQAAGRAKEVGVKKVIGVYKRTLVTQFLFESLLQSLVAMFIALLLVEVSIPFLNEFFSLKISLLGNPQTWLLTLQLLGIVLLIALLTGLYPAFYLSSFRPQQVLKGDFSNGTGGILIRRVLVGAQFVVSIGFVIGVLTVNYQLNYLDKRDKGFSTTGLMNVHMNITEDTFSKPVFDRLKKVDGVKHVAYVSSVIGDTWTIAQKFKYKGETVEMYASTLGIEGLQALDARVLSGRLFSRDVVSDTINNVIINESAAKLFGRNMLGQSIQSTDSTAVTVVGVIKDVQVDGFETATKPVVYVALNYGPTKHGVITMFKQTTLISFDRSKFSNLTSEIDKIYAEKNEFYPVSYSLVEDDLAAVFVEHERFEKMVAVFSGMSLSLSFFGLFALAAFITRQRTREIAVRKVLGAETSDIYLLLNKGYVKIVLIANLIAFPLAYVLIKKWLDTFAYRIDLPATPFVFAFSISVIITILTVTLQARKAVNTNPVNALKYE